MNQTTNSEQTQKAARIPTITPPASVRQTSEGTYVLEVEMPGVAKDKVEVAVEGSELTIVGTRTYPEVSGVALHREIRPGEFRRTFEMDAAIDTSRIKANMDNGLLRVELPLAEAVKPRRIEVQD
jgi:HSP20 family protein